MALVNVGQAFLFEHAQAFLKRKRDRDRGRERGHALVRPGLGLLPVEVKAGRACLGLLNPCALADADQGQSGRRHPPLLRAAHRDVDAPGVRLDVDRADRADAVDHDQSLGAARRPRQLAKRVGQTGRGLVVGEQHDTRLGVALQDHLEITRVHRLPPLELEAHNVSPIRRGQGGEALAEVSAQRDHDFVARRDQVGDGRLEASGTRARKQQEIVFRLEHALGAGGDLGQDGGEFRAPVVDHRPVHAAHHALGEGRRSRDSQLGLEGHGRAPVIGFGGLVILT